MILEALKRNIRLLEARLTPRRMSVQFEGKTLCFVHSIWWSDASQTSFDAEILPYFSQLRRNDYRLIIDAGAANGFFGIAAASKFPGAEICGFEPSPRQRVIIHRNLKLNRMTRRVQTEPYGLWNNKAHLAFRTHGAISALEVVEALPADLPFEETVETIPFDDWHRKRGPKAKVDLIKMDIEGAEIEALEGMSEVLKNDRPEIVLQAYHVRGGRRTFERCAEILEAAAYQCEEAHGAAGLLHAVPR